MSRIAYAIARDRPNLPLSGGLARFASEGLVIIHGPAPADAYSPGLGSLEAFASIVDALHTRETVLPLRFGSLHEFETGLEALLRSGLDGWRAGLDEVEGCDEMGLRVLLESRGTQGSGSVVAGPAAPPQGMPPGPGFAYLAGRRSELAVKDALIVEAARVEALVLGALEGLCRRSVVEGPAPGREGLLSFAFLVPRTDLDRFREAVRSLSEQGLGRLLVTGPWPPYHFASSPS